MSRKFGVEIEFISKMSSTTIVSWMASNGFTDKRWRIVPDGSLNGDNEFIFTHELVSPILDSGDSEVKSDLEKIIRFILSKSSVNDSCGLHVHVDGRDFGLEDIKNFVRFYTRWEQIFTMMVPQSRLNKKYCKPWSNKIEDYRIQQMVTCKSLSGFRDAWYNGSDNRDSKYHNSRYAFVNIHSWIQYGSIEFRGHQGTLNMAKIWDWVQICIVFVDHCKTTRSGFITPIKMYEVREKTRKDLSYMRRQINEFCERLQLSEVLKKTVWIRIRKNFIEASDGMRIFQ